MKQSFLSPGDESERHLRRRLLEWTTGTVLEMVGRAGSETVMLPHRPLDRWRPERDALLPGSLSLRRTRHPRLSLSLSGQAAIGMGGTFCELLPGDFAVHPGGMDVIEAGLPGVPAFERLWITPELQHLELELSTLTDGAVTSAACRLAYPRPDRAAIHPLMIDDLAVNVELDRRVALRAALLQIAHGVASTLIDAPVAAEPAWKDPLIKQLLAWMEQEPPGRWRVTLAARAMGCSRATLARRFQACVGEPLSAYARRRRLKHAELLLTRTPLPLNRVALECGFSDEAHLSHVFVREHRLTPGAFRRRAAGGFAGQGETG